jgi:hypothetical protein
MLLLNIIGVVKSVDLVELLIILIPVFVTIYFNNYKMRKENEKEMQKKADLIYVKEQDQAVKDHSNEQNKNVHKRIDGVVQDQKEDMREIRESMREIRKYILEK